MTKDEVRAKAKEVGLRVRDSFMDDIAENLLWMFVGFVGGFVLAKLL